MEKRKRENSDLSKQKNSDPDPIEDRDPIKDRVKGIVVELLGVEEERVVSGASFREDLEADSLDLVELIMAFEEEFGGEISDEDAQKIETVGQAVTYIKSNME